MDLLRERTHFDLNKSTCKVTCSSSSSPLFGLPSCQWPPDPLPQVFMSQLTCSGTKSSSNNLLLVTIPSCCPHCRVPPCLAFAACCVLLTLDPKRDSSCTYLTWKTEGSSCSWLQAQPCACWHTPNSSNSQETTHCFLRPTGTACHRATTREHVIFWQSDSTAAPKYCLDNLANNNFIWHGIICDCRNLLAFCSLSPTSTPSECLPSFF